MNCYLNGFNGVPECTGRFRYSPVYWEDLRAPATSFQGGGINDPSFLLFRDDGAGSQGVYAWQFSAVLNQDLFAWIQIPHSWKEGTTVYPHIHWAPMTAAAGDINWRFEWTFSSVGAVFPLCPPLSNLVVPAPGVAFQHTVTSFPSIAMPTETISTMMGLRLRRQGLSPQDTYPGLAAFFEFDLHIQINTPGSRQQFTK